MTLQVSGTSGLLENYDYQVLTNGFSYTFTSSNVLMANPAGALTSGTITMPATADNGMTITISTTQNLSGLTINANTGQSISSPPTSLSAQCSVVFIYRSTSSTWFVYNLTQTSQSGGSGFDYKNRFINGNMQIAQRGTSATITAASTIAAGYSTVDQWYVYCTGANVTAAQVAGSGAIKNNLQITGAASVTAVGIGQRIEQLNSYDLAGTTCTLSANISNSLLTTVTWTAYYANSANAFGTLASPTRTQISTGTFTVTSTLTNYNAQISVPAGATTGIEIVFTVGAQTSGTWVVGNVQLEQSSTKSDFSPRPFGTEFNLCQRYYEVIGVDGNYSVIFGYVSAASGESTYYLIPYKVTKLIMPTITFAGTWNTSNTAVSAINVIGLDTANINVQSNAAGSVYYSNGNAGAQIQISGVIP
jgi:hypothetical protein